MQILKCRTKNIKKVQTSLFHKFSLHKIHHKHHKHLKTKRRIPTVFRIHILSWYHITVNEKTEEKYPIFFWGFLGTICDLSRDKWVVIVIDLQRINLRFWGHIALFTEKSTSWQDCIKKYGTIKTSFFFYLWRFLFSQPSSWTTSMCSLNLKESLKNWQIVIF